MKKTKQYIWIMSLLAIPIIIYLYFLKCRTYTIYGDDLYLYHSLLKANSFSEIMGLSTNYEKYRPISVLLTKLVFVLFYKNLSAYYLFNVGIQTINTYILALILNKFLKSPFFALAFSLLYGLTRFSFFVTSQIYNGGVLEGLAISFFLLSLFFILNTVINIEFTEKKILYNFAISILFANMCIYTHERYIVLFPFIILVALFFPYVKKITFSNKIFICAMAIASIVLNVAIKKYVYSMPFFVGTGGTTITFSFLSAVTYFSQAVLCIFQINIGNLSHTGSPFTALPFLQQILVLLLTATLVTLFILYIKKYIKFLFAKYDANKYNIKIFILLPILFMFCLIPAIVTIRLEQRWLQASFCVFIIMIVIALNGIEFKDMRTKNKVFIVFILYFMMIDANYFKRAVPNYYITDAQNMAYKFEQAIKNGTIHPDTKTVYVWRKKTDENDDGCLKWDIGEGYIFEFYQKNSKKLIFADSTTHIQSDSLLNDLRQDNAQILYVKNDVIDITKQYLKDTLRHFEY